MLAGNPLFKLFEDECSPESVPCLVVSCAKPRHVERLLVIDVVHFGARRAANHAGLDFQSTAKLALTRNRARRYARTTLRLTSGIVAPPLSHVCGVTRLASNAASLNGAAAHRACHDAALMRVCFGTTIPQSVGLARKPSAANSPLKIRKL